MKALLLVVVLMLATLAFGASEESGPGAAPTPSSGDGYRLYGPGDIFKPRPARWQSRLKPQGWLGGSPPAIAENDPEYYPKLFNWLDKVGRR